MSKITTDAATATQQFMSKNLAARSKLKSGLAKEQEKQAELRAEFGSDAEKMFEDWRKEQETQEEQEAKKEEEKKEGGEKGTGAKKEKEAKAMGAEYPNGGKWTPATHGDQMSAGGQPVFRCSSEA